MGQMAATLTNGPQGALPSNTEKNLKKQANTIILRCGRQMEQLQSHDTDAESPDRAKEENKEETKKSEDSTVQ